jgi:hypothetical protein
MSLFWTNNGARNVTHMTLGKVRNAFTIYDRDPEWKRLLGRPWRRCYNNIANYQKHGVRMWTGFMWLGTVFCGQL